MADFGEQVSRKAAILDAAEALFAEHGYDAVTLRAIAARAGVDVAEDCAVSQIVEMVLPRCNPEPGNIAPHRRCRQTLACLCHGPTGRENQPTCCCTKECSPACERSVVSSSHQENLWSRYFSRF